MELEKSITVSVWTRVHTCRIGADSVCDAAVLEVWSVTWRRGDGSRLITRCLWCMNVGMERLLSGFYLFIFFFLLKRLGFILLLDAVELSEKRSIDQLSTILILSLIC